MKTGTTTTERAEAAPDLATMPEYRIWRGMRERCSNPRHNSYRWYGARGIKVCPEWDDFQTFYADVGPRPSSGHSLDRKDNSRGYEPGNAVWSTREQQNNNRRSTRKVIFNGQPMSLKQAWTAANSPVAYTTFHERIQGGWPLELALRSKPDTRLKRNSLARALEMSQHD